MGDLLIAPRAFFERLKASKPTLFAPWLVAVLASLLASLANVVATRFLPSLSFGSPLVFAVLGGIIFGLLAWGIYGLVLRLLAGAESRAWEVAGWASLPGVVVGLVLLPLAALFPVSGNLAAPPGLTDAEALREWTAQYTALVRGATFSRVAQGASVVGGIWSVGLTYVALRVLVPQRALIGTLGVAVISLGFIVWGLTR
ncbi:MAG: YIP1 family protein [Meiothermus silvanus]|nr:YIP1 family protein [Allomeiothermus silvanus]